MDLTASVSDLSQTEMLTVTEAIVPHRVHDQPGIWQRFNDSDISCNKALEMIILHWRFSFCLLAGILSLLFNDVFINSQKDLARVIILCVTFLVSLRCRDGPGLLESSGMPTVLNNVRSQTPDRLSSCSDTRRVRVSNTSTHPAAHWQKKFYLLIILECVFLCLYAAWWRRECCQRYNVGQKSYEPSHK